ncbi:MAG: hypothetical protein AB7D29_01335 [Campylobacterales bacterium]
MRLDELEATKIVLSVLGERGELKCEEELAVILKKRLTKKEMKAINAYVIGADKSETAAELNCDETRLSELVDSAKKKIKNESVHREFYIRKVE